MIIQRLAGIHDRLFAVVVNDDHETGMPEGIALWDGRSWSWVTRLENCWTVDCLYTSEALFLLDISGAIRRFSSDGYQEFSCPKYGFGSFTCQKDASFFLAGDAGKIGAFDGTRWTFFSEGTFGNYFAIKPFKDGFLVSGSGGALVRLDATGKLIQLASNCTDDLVAMDVWNSDFAAVVGGKTSEPMGKLLLLRDDTITTVETADRCYWISVQSEKEVYLLSLTDGLFVYDGTNVSVYSGITHEVTGLTKIGNDTYFHGREKIHIRSSGGWATIPFELEPIFLSFE